MFSRARALKISLPLLTVAIVSACLVVVTRPYVRYDGIFEDVSAWGAFFNVFGVAYAIVAGFLLVTVLNRYSALSQTIEDELNAVESVRDFLVYFGEDQHAPAQALRTALARYIKTVANAEWQEMADPAIPCNSDTSEELYEIMRCTGNIRVADDRNLSILSAVITSSADLAKMRTRRIALANERLPPRLRMLLIFMSVALTLAFLALGVRSLGVHVFMTAALSVSVYLIYWVIEDLDHPFYGIWNIDRTPLDELIKRFESETSDASPVAAQQAHGESTLKRGQVCS